MTTRNSTPIPARIARVRETLAGWGVSALLVNSPDNRRWLSGFTGSAGWLLVTPDQALLATDFRYWDQAQAQAPDFTLFRLKQEQKVTDMLATIAPTSVAVEANHLTLHGFKDLQKVDGIEWKPLEQTVEPFRMVKSPAEVAQIRAAAAITDRVMSSVPALARPGQPEKELAWLLEKSLRKNGATGMAFPVIVASGPNAALPHHRPGDRALQEGDTIVVDMGAALDGYNSDLTRTFYLGEEPPQRFWDIYNLTLSAQTAALGGMKAGMTGREIDALARDVIASAGHADHFGHGLGHGVGLAIHEDPRLSTRAENDVIPAGAITTVEPGVYLTGWGGVRLEDLVLVTADGIERLSHCPKEPLIAVAATNHQPPTTN